MRAIKGVIASDSAYCAGGVISKSQLFVCCFNL